MPAVPAWPTRAREICQRDGSRCGMKTERSARRRRTESVVLPAKPRKATATGPGGDAGERRGVSRHSAFGGGGGCDDDEYLVEWAPCVRKSSAS
ncbi:unnamed protein product [Lampetra planeri]